MIFFNSLRQSSPSDSELLDEEDELEDDPEEEEESLAFCFTGFGFGFGFGTVSCLKGLGFIDPDVTGTFAVNLDP